MTTIKLYNTRTRSKEVFTPIDPANVRMYVCGPTVYDRAHIGNARPVVVFDVLFRLLKHVAKENSWGKVTYVRNFTDVDDKINARAAETRQPGESTLDAIRRITDETTRWYLDDMDALGALRPTHMPRATEYIPQMVAMIEKLIADGHAYEAEGHVLFDVPSWPEYGRLSRRSTDELLAGARVDVAPYKRSAMDFVLWKPSDDDTPGWESPWGRGRPGWHIECSAMSKALLGEQFDIHGGGIDLVFPHHENELAQSCCANHTDLMANVWMHNGFLQVEGEKMSKSLGNFFTVKDLLDRFEEEFAIENIGPAIRLKLISTRYREPIDFTLDEVEQAAIKLGSWARVLDLAGTPRASPDESRKLLEGTEFLAALYDDLNTPEAIKELGEFEKQGSGPIAPQSGAFTDGTSALDASDLARRRLRAGLELLGFELSSMHALRHEAWSRKLREREISRDASVAERIEMLLDARQAARKARDFTRADAIRDGLAEVGVDVKDTPQGYEWHILPGFDPAKLEALK